MKINDVEETWRGPDYSKLSDKFAKEHEEEWLTHGKYIADIEQYGVRHFGKYYSVWENNILIAFTSLHDNIVDDVWVDSKYRGLKIFSKLLWFYKSRLNVDHLILGKIHSPDMQEIIKGMSRFSKRWYNEKTKEIEPFNINTLDQYYSNSGSTDWRLMIESAGNKGWPMFKGSSYIKDDYTELLK